MTIVDTLAEAPSPGKKQRPGVKRLFSGAGANLITFNFAPGQCLPEHRAAHPITVQCLEGTLLFSCEERQITLDPGVVVHLDAYVTHRVDCPENAHERNILLLTMLT